MSDEVLGFLSNLGAISEEKAVKKDIVATTLGIKLQSFQEYLNRLIRTGYLKQTGDRIYLTQVGLIRALSRFS